MSPIANPTPEGHHTALPAAWPALDLGAIRSRQQAAWASGDFAVVVPDDPERGGTCSPASRA
jgi:hypothetical protein